TCGQDGNPYNQLSTGEYAIVSTQPCIPHQNTDTSLSNVCESDQDYYWGNSDITCVDNPNFQDQLDNAYSAFSSASQGSSSGTPVPETAPSNFQNENTCTYDNFDSKCSSNDNTCRVCYSDNSSGTDQTSTTVHDQGAGGDDIICFNKTCSPDATPTATTNYNELCGTGQPFNKWACSPLSNTSLYYNPTAYIPLGALENPTIGSVKKGTSGYLGIKYAALPTCDAGMWGCSSGMNIVMRLYQATAAGATPNSPADSSGHNGAFTGSPEQISNTPVQLTNGTERVSTPGHGRQTKPSDEPSATNSSAVPLPPIYEVECTVGNNGLYFPCSDDKDGNINQMAIEKDWLSGNGLQANDDTANPVTGAYPAGHLSTTYDKDTTSNPLLQHISSAMLALGYLMIAPIAILIGYQLLWASWTYQRATAVEDLGRLVLGIMAVAISFQLVTFMIGLTNLFNHAIVLLHIQMPYSSVGLATINDMTTTYMLKGDTDPASFRGIVQPLVRWGCTINIFMGILTSKFATDLAGAITPIFGGMISLFGRINDAIEIFHNIGNFGMLLLSISLCVQVYLRILFINYYIVMAPVVFACWALPGGTGRKVMGQWLKGLVAVLLVQTVQLFVLTTMPLLLPPFPPIEAQGTGAWGLLNTFLNQLPGILVLIATMQVPKMMGTGVTKAIAQAGTVAAGGVAAAATAAYNIV
ncbi:MAG TPA: hypothetical protein VHV10_19505, partial [Ktedonobacteraceae bacterium]|nr:hypothetical protein [Ktedonobacteraceae bacterium]